MVHQGKDTYIQDVFVFTKRAKDIATIKGAEIVRTNLALCLRGTTLTWYTTELTAPVKRLLKLGKNLDEWVEALHNRFKKVTLNAMLAESYITEDARRHREPRSYAQYVIHNANSAGFEGFPLQQMLMIYNHIDMNCTGTKSPRFASDHGSVHHSEAANGTST